MVFGQVSIFPCFSRSKNSGWLNAPYFVEGILLPLSEIPSICFATPDLSLLAANVHLDWYFQRPMYGHTQHPGALPTETDRLM